MLLEIDDEKSIADIRERFQESFPHLKIEFYPHVHQWQSTAQPLIEEQQIGSVRHIHEPGVLEIRSTSRIHEVMEGLKKRFGLHARIFRSHEGNWAPVSLSDNLGLQEQSDSTEVSGQNVSGDISWTGEEEEPIPEI
jgi:hypothetical protein